MSADTIPLLPLHYAALINGKIPVSSNYVIDKMRKYGIICSTAIMVIPNMILKEVFNVNKKMLSKVLSVLLSSTMLVGTIPATTFAEENPPELEIEQPLL